jgi:hypothetical protein
VDFRNVSEMDTGDSSLYIILATQEVEIWRMEILRPAWAKKVMRHSPSQLPWETKRGGLQFRLASAKSETLSQK